MKDESQIAAEGRSIADVEFPVCLLEEVGGSQWFLRFVQSKCGEKRDETATVSESKNSPFIPTKTLGISYNKYVTWIYGGRVWQARWDIIGIIMTITYSNS
jgi:hypothetical protein